MMCFSSWSKSKYSASSLSPVEEKSIREVGGGDVASSGLLFALRNRFVIKGVYSAVIYTTERKLRNRNYHWFAEPA